MYTIYDEDEGKIREVDEPDPSLNYTYADYYKWKFLERLELLRGKIVRLAAANTKHQRVSMKLGYMIYGFLRGRSCEVFLPPYDVRLPVKNRKRDDQITTVVQPDVTVFCDPAKIDERGACGIPDLLVEVLSPGNSQYDLRDKFDVYQEANVKEYWIVNPIQESVMVCLLEKEGQFAPSKILTGEQKLEPLCLPGFSIEVKELFTR
jgi:Uma2 family endonuclease